MKRLLNFIVLFTVMLSLTSPSYANQCIGFYGVSESKISLAPRIKQAELLLERKLKPREIEAIWTAHYIGLNEIGKNGKPAQLGNFTSSQIARKVAALKAGKFESREIRLLMDKGITGFELFFEVYGVIAFARDLWKLFTYRPEKPDDYIQQFSAPLENGKVRPPEKAFEDVFADHFKTYYSLAPVYPILENNLGYLYSMALNNYKFGSASNNDYYQREADKETKRLAKAYADNVQMALLVNTSGDKKELLIGVVEPVPGALGSIKITSEVRVHTASGIKTVAVKDIVRSTNADLRNRYHSFAKIFEVFNPQPPENIKEKLSYISDLKSSDIRFWADKAKSEIDDFKRIAETNQYIAFLVKDSAGNQRLVIGKPVSTELEMFTKKFDTQKEVPNPKSGWLQPSTVFVPAKEEKTTAMIGKFIVETENGKEFISRDDVVAYTKVDLRDRTKLFEKEFREFGISKTTDYDVVKRLRKQHEEKTTLAFLVKENDGAQKLVVGVPVRIESDDRRIVSIEIQTADQQIIAVEGGNLLLISNSSVRSYVGLDMPLLQKAFASIPSQKSDPAEATPGNKMVIKDASLHLSDKDQAKAASQLLTAEKIPYIESLIGRKLDSNGIQLERLFEAIFVRALPLTRSELLSGVQKPITPDDLELKKSYLESAGFSQKEIDVIAASGVLGVVE